VEWAFRLADAPIPPLENGDRLTRREFERRYEAMPQVKKAELIEGVVYMPSPVHVAHGEPHIYIATWLVTYRAAAPGVRAGDNVTTRVDADNDVQPDVYLRLESELGGRSSISADDYIEGAPELVVEIAASSATIDLRDKLTVYRRNGVQEYIIWQVYDRKLDWFRLDEGEYLPLTPEDDGLVRSLVFPGLCLNVAALLEGDLAGVLAALRRGQKSPEYKAFVKELRKRKLRQISKGRKASHKT
jgi:Uma2 family endonuclease